MTPTPSATRSDDGERRRPADDHDQRDRFAGARGRGRMRRRAYNHAENDEQTKRSARNDHAERMRLRSGR